MNQNNVEDNFNVNKPTEENIEYAFKNLLYYLTGSVYLNIYKYSKKE